MTNQRSEAGSLDRQLRQYMLGQLDEGDASRFEERLMTEDEFFQQAELIAEAVEDELADEYASGAMTESDRKRFEGRLARSKSLQEKLWLRNALAEYTKKQRFRNWWIRFSTGWPGLFLRPASALALGTIVLVAGGVWSFSRITQLETRLDAAARQQAGQVQVQSSLEEQVMAGRQRIEQLSRELAEAAARGLGGPGGPVSGLRQVAPLVTVILQPGLVRSGGVTTRITLRGGDQMVELRLDIGIDEFRNYRAVLSDSRGRKVLEQYQLAAVKAGRGVHVVMSVPARILLNGDYSVVLYGEAEGGQSERIDGYNFRIFLERASNKF